MSRRDVLAAMLGAPAALAACRRTSAVPLPPGELVFASERVGHRLRDGPPPEVPQDRWERVGVVIIGAGVAGLSAAWRLARAGCEDFVVLELDPVEGGTAKSQENAVSAYPWGAHYITAPTRDAPLVTTVLDEMGIVEGEDEQGAPVIGEEHLCRDPEERIFYRGRWYDGLYLRAGASAEDRAELAAFRAEVDRLAALRDAAGRRAFTIPVARCSEDAALTALDRMSMAEWLDRRGWRSARLRWFVEYACRDDYGALLETTSAWAALFYFASRVTAPGADPQPVITWPEGNGRLVHHLRGASKGKIRLGAAALEVAERGGGSAPHVEVTAIEGEPKRPFGIRAEHVICAVPQFVAGRLLRAYRERPPAHLGEFAYGAWMVANLTLRDHPASEGSVPAWDNVLYESPSLGYVVATHQRGIDRGPTVLTYYYPLCDADPRRARERLLSAGWADWADVTLTDLARAHPDLRTLVQTLDVVRWGHAMIRPRPGFVFGGARAKAARPVGRVHFAHSDLSGIALFEEALHQGVRAAEEVLAARGVPFTSLR